MNYQEAVEVAKQVQQGADQPMEKVDEALEVFERAWFCAEMSDSYSVTRSEQAEIAPYRNVLKQYKNAQEKES